MYFIGVVLAIGIPGSAWYMAVLNDGFWKGTKLMSMLFIAIGLSWAGWLILLGDIVIR